MVIAPLVLAASLMVVRPPYPEVQECHNSYIKMHGFNFALETCRNYPKDEAWEILQFKDR